MSRRALPQGVRATSSGQFQARRMVRGHAYGHVFPDVESARAWLAAVDAAAAVGELPPRPDGFDPRLRLREPAKDITLKNAWRVFVEDRHAIGAPGFSDSEFTSRWLVKANAPLSKVLREVSVADAVEFRDRLAATLSRSSQSSVLRPLRRLFEWAVEQEFCVRNPFKDVHAVEPVQQSHRPNARRVEAWTPRTFLGVVAWMPWQLRIVVAMAYFMGLRHGEILGLDRARVDLTKGTITIQQIGGGRYVGKPAKVATSAIRTKGRGGAPAKGSPTNLIGKPKTLTSYRTLPLPEELVKALRSYADAVHGPVPTDPVELRAWGELPFFVGEDGRRESQSAVRQSLSTAAARTGRSYEDTGVHPSPRFLRKCCASNLSANDVRGQDVSSWLGHKTSRDTDGASQTTHRVYVLPVEGHLKDVVKILNEVIDRECPDLGTRLLADPANDGFMTLSEAAHVLMVGVSTLRRWMALHAILAYNPRKVGAAQGVRRDALLIRVEDVELIQARLASQRGHLNAGETMAYLDVTHKVLHKWIDAGHLVPERSALGSGGPTVELLFPLKAVVQLQSEIDAERGIARCTTLTVAETAARLGVATATAYRLCTTGVLALHQMTYDAGAIRVTLDSIRAYEQRHADTADTAGPGRWLSNDEAAHALGRRPAGFASNARRRFSCKVVDGHVHYWIPDTALPRDPTDGTRYVS